MSESGVLEGSQREILGSGYRADIDGLRAIAVLAVLFFHAGSRVFQGGFTGVDIFFVISGFLIGGHIYAEELGKRFTFGGFYRRRAKRILPALFAVLLSTLLLGTMLLSPSELRGLATESIATLASASNLFFWQAQGYFAGRSELRPLLMTWSLGVEEQFYILVPLLMVWLMRKRLHLAAWLAILAFVSLAVASYQVPRSPDTAFYLLPSRAWELLAGVLLAVVRSKNIAASGSRRALMGHLSGAAGFVLVAGPIFFLRPSVPFPGLAALPTVLGTVLLLGSPHGFLNRKILSASPLRFVGKISYSLYLWHWPLLSLLTITLGKKPYVYEAFAVLGIAFVLAAASQRYVEQPFRQSHTGATPLLRRYAVVSLLLALLFLGVRQTYGLGFRSSILTAAERPFGRNIDDACAVTDGVSAPDASPFCLEDKGRGSIALWGDSHVSAIAEAMRTKVNKAGYDFIEMSKTACPPLDGAGLYFRQTPSHAQECIAFNREAVQELTGNQHVKAVILEANWKSFLVEPYEYQTGWIVRDGKGGSHIPDRSDSIRLFGSALAHTIEELKAAGKEVIVFQDVPTFDLAPIWRFRTAHLIVRTWLFRHLRPAQAIDPGIDVREEIEEDDRVRGAIAAAAKSGGARVEDMEKFLCASDHSCSYRIGDQLFYKDTQHLSPAGAQYVLSGVTLPN